jgi:DNA-binding CsgD family transcriptional regulator
VRRSWDPEEEQFLMAHTEWSGEQIAQKLDRTYKSVVHHRQALGLKKQPPFSQSEIDFVVQNYGVIPTSHIAARLCRTENAIRSLANRQHKTWHHRFTPEESALIKQLASIADTVTLAKRLGHTPDSIRKHARRLGVTLKSADVGLWTEQEDGWLRENYGQISIRNLTTQLCRSYGAIRTRARKLGLLSRNSPRKWLVTAIDQKVVQELYLSQTLSSAEIAEQLQCSPFLVMGVLRRLGFLRTAGRTKHYTSLRRNRNGEIEHKVWETQYGYLMIAAYDEQTDRVRPIFRHRLVMEQHLGRKLEPNEVVHHINHNKQDNRIENLMILSRGEHTSLHFRGKPWRIARPGRIDQKFRRKRSKK